MMVLKLETCVLYLFLEHLINFELGASHKERRRLTTSYEDVVQVSMQVVLPVPAFCDSRAYHAHIRESFLSSYQKERKFQMSLQALELERGA